MREQVDSILEGLNRIDESKVIIDSNKEYEKAVEFFKRAKKGTKIKLAKDLYYGAMNISIKDATSKYGFKVGNDYGDGTGEYIIPKGTVLTVDKVYADGTAPYFTYKGLDIEFTNVDDVVFEADVKSLYLTTSYFTFNVVGDGATMTDLNGNVTNLDKADVDELVNALKKVSSALK